MNDVTGHLVGFRVKGLIELGLGFLKVVAVGSESGLGFGLGLGLGLG